jgi:hypothetical protein
MSATTSFGAHPSAGRAARADEVAADVRIDILLRYTGHPRVPVVEQAMTTLAVILALAPLAPAAGLPCSGFTPARAFLPFPEYP